VSATRASTRSHVALHLRGYCELACPFDAIVLGNDFEFRVQPRRLDLHEGTSCSRKPIKQVAGRRRDLYDTPIPYYKDHS